MNRQSKVYLLILFISIISCTYALGETYKWEDDNVMYFTDNPESVPEKYREKVLGESREEIQTPVADVIESLPLNQKQNNNELNYETSNATKPAQLSIDYLKNTYVQKNIKEDFEPVSKFATAVILISTALAMVWIILLTDIIRSKFEISSNKVLWLLLVIFMAPLGMLLYLIIGLEQKKESFST